MTTINRLVGFCSVVVDLVLHVPALPEQGGDVLATASSTEVGGGLNALAAAVRAGLPAAYAGGHGSGPFGDLVRVALVSTDVPPLVPPTDGVDSGFTVVLVDAPPMLHVGDAITLSSKVDAIVVVTRVKNLRRQMLAELGRQLSTVPTRVVGYIATGAAPGENYEYGYGYGSGYRHTHYSSHPTDHDARAHVRDDA